MRWRLSAKRPHRSAGQCQRRCREPELAVEQGDVVGVDIGAGREQLRVQLVWRDWLTCRVEATSPVPPAAGQTEETAPAGPGRSPVIGVVVVPPWRRLFEVTPAGKWDLAASQVYDNGVL